MRNTTRAFLFLIAILTLPHTGRCQSFGTIDESYATSGIAVFNDHGEEYPTDLVLRPNGSEFMLGSQFINELSVATIRSVTSAGGADNSFSGDGWLSTTFANENVVFLDGKVDATGRLVVFGGVGTEEPDIDVLVQRYQTTGSVDATFGGAQGSRLSYPGGAIAYEGVIMANGKMVVLMQSFGENSAVLVKLSSTGQVETAFGTNGYALIAPPAGMVLYPEHLLALPTGKFLVGATIEPVDEGTSPTCFIQFTADGDLDESFAPDGMIVVDLSAGIEPWLTQTLLADMALLPNGDVSAILSAPDVNIGQRLVSMEIPASGVGGCVGIEDVTEQGYQAECAVVLDGGNVLVCSSLYNSVCRVAHVQGDCTVDGNLGGTGFIPMTGAEGAYPQVMVRRNDGRVDVLMSIFSFEEPSSSTIVRLHADDVASVADPGASSGTLRIEPQPVTEDVLHIRSSARLANRLQLVGMDGRLVADLSATATDDARHRVEVPMNIVNGSYILRASVDGRSFAQLVIVQR